MFLYFNKHVNPSSVVPPETKHSFGRKNVWGGGEFVNLEDKVVSQPDRTFAKTDLNSLISMDFMVWFKSFLSLISA